MTRFIFFLSFFLLFSNFVSVDHAVETCVSQQSSLLPIKKNSCHSFYERSINLTIYEDYLQSFFKSSDPNAVPKGQSREEILAWLDWQIVTHSTNESNFRPLKDVVLEGKKTSLKELYAILNTFQAAENPSELKLKKTTGRLLKLLQTQTLKEKFASLPENVQKQWDEVPDEAIHDHFSKIAILRGLKTAFQSHGMLRSNSSWERLKNTLGENADWISNTLAIALSIPSAMNGFFPPMIPEYDFTKRALNKNGLQQLVLEKGVNDSIPEIREQLGFRNKWSYRLQLLARTVGVISTSILLIHLPSEIQEQRDRQARETGTNLVQAMDQLAAGPSTPEGLAKAEFDRFIASQKANGNDANPNSPANLVIKKMFQDAFAKKP